MTDDWGDILDSFEKTDKTRERYYKSAFGWPGGKMRSLKYILPLLPYTNRYIEVCGGSGVVLMNREPVKFEVLNDIDAGITDFYRCIRNPETYRKLVERLKLSIHSREDFLISRDTWKNVHDPIERAARWYTMVCYSFGKLGTNWGRSKGPPTIYSGNIDGSLKEFPRIHARLRRVQIDNMDAIRILEDYDHPDSVFYIDPDYPGTSVKYKAGSVDIHLMLKRIFECKGFVALSGYSLQYIEDLPWDERYEWDSRITLVGKGTPASAAIDKVNESKKYYNREVLWIKKANK